MPDYIPVADAIHRDGLRLVLSPGAPGPWSVAARAILDLKRITYVPVAQVIGQRDPLLRKWSGQESAPVAMFNNERPRTRWDEILLLAERLAPNPPLIPVDEVRRVEMFGLANAICGEDGFGWNFRIIAFTAPGIGEPGSPSLLTAEQIEVMQLRYWDQADSPERSLERIKSILELLAKHLRKNEADGNSYFVGDSLTALDIYWVAFSNLICPLPPEHCPMPEAYRLMTRQIGKLVKDDIDPCLIEHRNKVLVQYFQLPMVF